MFFRLYVLFSKLLLWGQGLGWLLGLWCVLCGTLMAQMGGSASLRGRVLDAQTGEPLPYAHLELHELHLGQYTDSAGHFVFLNLKPGRYHLHATYVGYAAWAQTVQVPPPGDEVALRLWPTQIESQAVLIEASPLKRDERELPLTIQRVDAQAIRTASVLTLAEALSQLPGVNFLSLGPGISKPMIRGLGFNRVAVIEHGIRQEGQQWGADHGLELDPFRVGSVDLIKGPTALLYGPDAMAGVLVVRPPAPPPIDSTQAELSTLYRSVNDGWGLSGAAALNRGGRWLQARITLQEYADLRVPAEHFSYNRYILTLPDQRLKNTAGRERHAALSAGVQRKWGYSQLHATVYHQQAGMFAGAVGIPRAYQLAHDGDWRNVDLPRFETTHIKVVQQTNVQLGRGWLEVDAGWQRNLRQEHSQPHAHGDAPQPDGTLALRMELHTATLNAHYHLPHGNRWQSVAGVMAQGQWHQRKGFEYLLPDHHNWQGGVFWQEQYQPTDRLTLHLGARADAGSIHIRRFEEPIYRNGEVTGLWERTPTIYRQYSHLTLGGGASWFPAQAWNLKLHAGNYFRYPTPAELGSNGVHHGTFRHEQGNATLAPERGWQADLAAIWQHPRARVSLTPFVNYFTNYIYLRPSGRFSTLPEAGMLHTYTQSQALHLGGELAAEYHPVPALHLGIGAEIVRSRRTDLALPIPFQPPPRLLAEVEYEIALRHRTFRRLVLATDALAWADQRNVVQNEPPTPGAAVWNAHTALDMAWGRHSLTLTLRGLNLLNRNYLRHLSQYRILNLPEAARNWVLTLHWAF
jgi:iron complex outermembrane receptor protein